MPGTRRGIGHVTECPIRRGYQRDRRFQVYAGYVAISLFFFLFAPAAVSQEIDSVDIVPRSQPRPVTAATGITVNSFPTPRGKIFKSQSDLVLVPVSVRDSMGRLVTGMSKSNFAVYEDKKKQEIQSLSSEDAPVSIGIIFDVSGSMITKFEKAREAIVDFLESANPQDEFFLITFSEQPDLAEPFTTNIDELQNKLVFTRPKGLTALLDAIYLGMDEMRHAIYPRRALLIISDGGDNHSRYTDHEAKSAIEEADVQVFTIGIFDPFPATPEEQSGPGLLDEMAEATGGFSYTVSDPNDLADIATKIGTALRNEYILAYKPALKPRDGTWHKIKVKLIPPKGLPPLHVTARNGYYAPTQQ